ncbi:hypothetical protein P9112_006779 [Eukaryota sp. TZLM1-RC]
MNPEVELEVESLQAIYMDDFVQKDDISFTIDLFAPSDSERCFGIRLFITYTEDYPQSPPTTSIETIQKSFSLTKLKAKIDETITGAIEQDFGPCIFLVCEAVVDELEVFVAGPKSMHEDMVVENPCDQVDELSISEKERITSQDQSVDYESKKILFGTPFSVEAFLNWRARFEAEHNIEVVDHSGVLTGKQIFLAGEVEEVAE